MATRSEKGTPIIHRKETWCCSRAPSAQGHKPYLCGAWTNCTLPRMAAAAGPVDLTGLIEKTNTFCLNEKRTSPHTNLFLEGAVPARFRLNP